MHLKKIEAGGVILPGNVFLAPLAGYTNVVFRKLCLEMGAGLTFTEMVSAKGLCYGSEKTNSLLAVPEDYGGALACQLFGNEPEDFRRVVQSEALAPYDIIDINMGCPVPKIFKNGEGCALMGDIPLAQKIISACKSGGKAVSVKFRTGFGGKNVCADFAKACRQAGADMITIHGRQREQMYSGEVDYSSIAQCKRAVDIPVIANGGIFCADDADKMIENTGADGVMIARGAMYSPWIFAEICGNPPPDKKKFIISLTDGVKEKYGEKFALVYSRKMASFFVRGQAAAAHLRAQFISCENLRQLKQAVLSADII